MGKVELTVVSARNLYNMQLIGVPDPFIRLTCGDKKYKTKVSNDTLNPTWNETFRFQIPDENSTQILLEVWNKCTYSDDLMGYYTFSLAGMTKGVVKDQWYILEKSKTEAELRVRILAVDFGIPPTPEQQWMVTSDITRDPVARAIEDGTWRPGQKQPPPPSGPQQQPAAQPQAAYASQQPIQAATQPPAQYVQQVPMQVQYTHPPPIPMQPVAGGYYPAPPQQPAYPPQPIAGSYYPAPPQQPAYPPQPVAGGYYPAPPQQPAYPPQPIAGSYYPAPPQQPAYPPQPVAGGYYPAPPQQPAYPPQPPAGTYYPPQQPAYSMQPGYRY